MPGRLTLLVNDEIYHIVNRGVALTPLFKGKRDYQRLLNLIVYYQNRETPIKYSKLSFLPAEDRKKLLDDLKNKKDFCVSIIAYCLMPNHIHLLLRQISDNGISKFMGNVCNSYSRYFNTKYERNGPLFQGRFKAVRILTEEQFLHMTRYIHLNPYSGLVIKKLKAISSYPYSSVNEYLEEKNSGFCDTAIVKSQMTEKGYLNFLLDNAEYQKSLEEVKHLLIDSS